VRRVLLVSPSHRCRDLGRKRLAIQLPVRILCELRRFASPAWDHVDMQSAVHSQAIATAGQGETAVNGVKLLKVVSGPLSIDARLRLS
jgi:hypothetical protein